jgi:hypothetical protein
MVIVCRAPGLGHVARQARSFFFHVQCAQLIPQVTKLHI